MGRRSNRGNKSTKCILASSYNPESDTYTVSTNDPTFHQQPVISIVQPSGGALSAGGSRSARKEHERSVKFSLIPKMAYNKRLTKVIHRLRNKLEQRDPTYVKPKMLMSGGQHESLAISNKAMQEWYRQKEVVEVNDEGAVQISVFDPKPHDWEMMVANWRLFTTKK